MRVLKNKIAKAQRAALRKSSKASSPSPVSKAQEEYLVHEMVKQDIRKDDKRFDERESVTPKKFLFAKNMVRNYSKAICKFCVSKVAEEYLVDILKKNNFKITPQDFLNYMNKEKKNVESIPTFKKLLIVEPRDS